MIYQPTNPFADLSVTTCDQIGDQQLETKVGATTASMTVAA